MMRVVRVFQLEWVCRAPTHQTIPPAFVAEQRACQFFVLAGGAGIDCAGGVDLGGIGEGIEEEAEIPGGDSRRTTPNKRSPTRPQARHSGIYAGDRQAAESSS